MQPCPSDDELGAHLDHALAEGEAARIADHLDSCDACRALVIAAIHHGRTLAHGTPAPALRIGGPSLVGTRMGRYELRALLGAGGMGQVLRAYDAELEREIAVKVLHPGLAGAASDRLIRESRSMAKIAHPSVITVYDVGRADDDAVFIAMELIRGETLGAYLARTPLAWRDIVQLFERAGAGLAAAHAAGIVHRDFKPDNVLVEGDAQRVVVTDFGIALAASGHAPAPTGTDRIARLTATGAAVGTPAYMAPEQLAGGEIDQRADVFAFCVALWEALFGERPYRGATVDELRAAMRGRPRPPRRAVPARVVRALERGLAWDREARWAALPPLLDELAAARTQRRRTLALGAIAAVGLAGAGVALLATPSDAVDPCAVALPAVTGLDAAGTAAVDKLVTAWRTTHAATCSAQPLAVTTCLDARRTELSAVADEIARSGPAKAALILRTVADPARCHEPRSGMLVSRSPADPALRPAVADLRYRGFAIEAARDRSELVSAQRDAEQLVADAATAWPIARAEALYLLGTTYSMGGDNKRALATLREAAAYAERVHHDYIATNCWIQLIQITSFDEGDPERGLEYATYADAALDRIGRPAEVETILLYFQGTALVEAGRPAEAEPIMRRAIALAERSAPQYAAQAQLGLGHLLEAQNKYDDATEPLRKALAGTAPTDPAVHTYHERLAMNLAFRGLADEAEQEARTAVALVDRQLGDDSTDRAVAHASLGQVLHKANKLEPALAETRVAKQILARSVGERHLRYGELLTLEATLLLDLERYREADTILGRACEIIAFGAGDDSGGHADCLLSRGTTLANLGKTREAVALIDRALAILTAQPDADTDARTANAYLQRGELNAKANKFAAAIPDVEHAVAIFSTLQLDAGHLAAAQILLADLLWPSDRPRATTLARSSLQLFARASASWTDMKTEAHAWVRDHHVTP